MVHLSHARTQCPTVRPPPQRPRGAQAEDYADQVEKGKHNQENINAFWKTKRNAREMDEVYRDLMRSGRSSVKRHYELTGRLAEEETRQNPEYARIQALLALPADEEAASAPPAPAASAPVGGGAKQ